VKSRARVVVIGGVFLSACLLAIPNLKLAIVGGFGPASAIDANLGNAFSTVLLLVVSTAIFVCCLAIRAATVRLCFWMSPDPGPGHVAVLARRRPPPALVGGGHGLHRRTAILRVRLVPAGIARRQRPRRQSVQEDG